eukprot:TRINITY_DN25969_c0_g1_i9.p1 TRINITY_DN25969_c0_g1~~TRINITY_DN25969_c0_g1_i9.p1  ORF type:complete len:107 (-),score=39.82 TRINITY_DN25969_c0_g1_i9:16-336(-)
MSSYGKRFAGFMSQMTSVENCTKWRLEKVALPSSLQSLTFGDLFNQSQSGEGGFAKQPAELESEVALSKQPAELDFWRSLQSESGESGFAKQLAELDFRRSLQSES